MHVLFGNVGTGGGTEKRCVGWIMSMGALIIFQRKKTLNSKLFLQGQFIPEMCTSYAHIPEMST